MIELLFDKGTILVKSSLRIPYTVWDNRTNTYRTLSIHYKDIRNYLELSKLDFEDRVENLIPCPDLKCTLTLREYQKKALNIWLKTKYGVIVLPTGAGKTIIGIKAISILNVPAIVIVPTLDLVEQWRSQLSKKFQIDIGVYSGESHILKPITVATYDTAYIRAPNIGNKFRFIIFDEVHHLPSPGYSNIAEMFTAPYRLGLTATYEREDGLHTELERLVGGKVYELTVDELTGKHLAEYTVKKIFVQLTQDEKKMYDNEYKKFVSYLREKKIILRTHDDFQRFIMRCGIDGRGREALLARHKARTIALNSRSKLNVLADILEKHWGERTIIFTEYNSLVYTISKTFFIPAITHKTRKDERTEILDKFREGIYKIVVTSKVLEEGIDVPEASVGIILSGSGSVREYRQRLGRVLRKKDKPAILYEIVSSETSEIGISRRRHRKVGRSNVTY